MTLALIIAWTIVAIMVLTLAWLAFRPEDASHHHNRDRQGQDAERESNASGDN